MKKRNTQELTKDILFKIFKKEKKPLAPTELVAILSLNKKQGKTLKQLLKNLVRDGSIVELKINDTGCPGK